MTVWNDSKMTIYWASDDACETYPCSVKIDEKEIIVEYDDDGLVQYRGTNRGDGHFELESQEVNGRASLHMFPSSSILEGSWIENHYKGMWRIELGIAK